MSFRRQPRTSDTSEEPSSPAAAKETSDTTLQTPGGDRNMLPARHRRRLGLERLLVRLVATCGIVGIGVAIGAILRSNNTAGWIIGLVVAAVSVVLSAILWSSREL